jgi:Ca2+-binding EF-hand superfamily protein
MYSGMQRPDPSKMVDNLFAKIDTRNQGYIDKTQLQAAFDQMPSNGAASGTSSSASSVDQIFKAFDGNGDNQLTKQEFTDGLKKLADQFESQSGSMGMGGMPPMMGGSVGGMSTSAADQGGATGPGAAMAGLSETKTYDPADTNQDGTVSVEELLAYQAKTSSSSTASATSSSVTASSASQNNGIALMKQIGKLLSAYGGPNQDFGLSGTANSFSIIA